jgi:hypothetical protein
MRHKTFASVVMLACVVLSLYAHAQQPGTPAAPSPPWNDNSLITVEKAGGNPAVGRRIDAGPSLGSFLAQVAASFIVIPVTGFRRAACRRITDALS